MIFKMKFYFYQIYKIIFLLLLTNISNSYAHNLVNGGCKNHCGHKVKAINNEEKLNNEKRLNNEKKLNIKNDQMNFESKNSCLNKSLCRG